MGRVVMKRVVGMLVVACVVSGVGLAVAEGLRDELADVEVSEVWRYDDWEGAKVAAARDGKPIFALFR